MEDSQFKVPPRPRYMKGPPSRNFHATIKTFLQQVRESRVRSTLTPAMEFVIAEINKNAQPHGKCYELVKVEKYVRAPNHRTMLITFTVNQVVAPPNNTNVEETIQAMVFVDGGRKYRLLSGGLNPPHDDDDDDSP